MIKLHQLSPDFTVVNRGLRPPASTRTESTDQYLRQGSEPELEIDGALLSVASIQRDCIEGHTIAYQEWRRQAKERGPLKVRPLAVTGILSCEDLYLMGKRRKDAMEDPRSFEFVPAGGIDLSGGILRQAPSPIDQLVKEAKEELLLDAHELGTIRFIICAENTRSGVVDLVYRAQINLSIELAQRRMNSVPLCEHSELTFVSLPLDHAIHQDASTLTRRLAQFIGESE